MLVPMQGRTGSSPRVTVVEAPEAVAVLVDLGGARCLAPFLGRPSSATEAARELDLPLSVLRRRIATYRRLGLLTVDHVETRSGSPITRYIAPTEFFVPLHAVPDQLLMVNEHRKHDEFVRGLEAVIRGAAADLAEPGIRVCRDPSGRIAISGSDGPGRTWHPTPAGAPPVAFEWSTLHLDEHDARQLQHDLEDVVMSYRDRQRPGAPTYVLGACLAPAPP